jgi:hypothetical protein
MKFAIFLFLMMFACETNEHRLSREALRDLLSTYESSPVISSAYEDVAGSLLELASDENEKRFYRERALFLLRRYPEERVFFFLWQWPTNTEPFLAVRAFSSLAALSQQEWVGVELSKRVLRMNYPTMGEEALHLLSLPRFGSE